MMMTKAVFLIISFYGVCLPPPAASECQDCPDLSPTKATVGTLSDWSEWSKCSASCRSTAHQSRNRTCAPSGTRCYGKTAQKRACIPKPPPCPAAVGFWGEWEAWSDVYVQYRSRKCLHPHSQYGANNCLGSKTEERVWDRGSLCKVDGSWGEWHVLFPCTRSCGRGTQVRTRACDNPHPKHGGLPCIGSSSVVEACNTQPCSVDGGWSSWSNYTQCTKSCGGGTMNRRRFCNDPKPRNGGSCCAGDSLETIVCNSTCCPDMLPVDGAWSSWTNWTACSTSCGGGESYRRRWCDNPAPQNGGKNCSGNDTEVQECSSQCCPVNGQWSSWGSWESCSRTCGNGTVLRRRHCNDSCGGQQCSGSSIDQATCCLGQCPGKTAYYVDAYTVYEAEAQRSTYYTNCGFIDWNRCTRYRLSYTRVAKTAYRRKSRLLEGEKCD
ncbi:coadhesin-like [Oscarella lobularis]|uniref:coadhesin-like n=1 Tax=Oscarella lobularis TaxID=121494 RepID=UPI003313EB2F